MTGKKDKTPKELKKGETEKIDVENLVDELLKSKKAVLKELSDK